jgi:cellulose biosynthesis protein BcsQ
MGSKIFCLASAKGGSGKTIISATLGTALAHLGKKVLLIDADGSTNGMTLFYLERVVQARDSTEHSTDPSGIFDPGDAIRLAIEIQPDLWLLPATFVMTETHEVTADGFGRSLQAAISRYAQQFDYILIDAQAGIEDFALAAIEQSDQTIIVSEYDPISKKGIDRFRKMIISEKSPWILFNKVLPEFMELIGDPLGISDLLPPISWNADVVRAYVQGKLALNMEEGNVFTIGLLRAVGVLFGREVQDLVKMWRRDKDDFIRAPIRKQLDEVVDELDSVQRAKVSAEFEATSGGSVSIYFWMIVALILVGFVSGFTYSSFMKGELSSRTVKLNEYITRVDEGIKRLKTNPDYDPFQLKKLNEERKMISEERRAIEERIHAIGNMRLIMVGITVVLFACFPVYYIWHARSRKQRKLELLQQVAIYSDRVDELRSMKSQLIAYEQSSLDKLFRSEV